MISFIALFSFPCFIDGIDLCSLLFHIVLQNLNNKTRKTFLTTKEIIIFYNLMHLTKIIRLCSKNAFQQIASANVLYFYLIEIN